MGNKHSAASTSRPLTPSVDSAVVPTTGGRHGIYATARTTTGDDVGAADAVIATPIAVVSPTQETAAAAARRGLSGATARSSSRRVLLRGPSLSSTRRWLSRSRRPISSPSMSTASMDTGEEGERVIASLIIRSGSSSSPSSIATTITRSSSSGGSSMSSSRSGRRWGSRAGGYCRSRSVSLASVGGLGTGHDVDISGVGGRTIGEADQGGRRSSARARQMAEGRIRVEEWRIPAGGHAGNTIQRCPVTGMAVVLCRCGLHVSRGDTTMTTTTTPTGSVPTDSTAPTTTTTTTTNRGRGVSFSFSLSSSSSSSSSSSPSSISSGRSFPPPIPLRGWPRVPRPTTESTSTRNPSQLPMATTSPRRQSTSTSTPRMYTPTSARARQVWSSRGLSSASPRTVVLTGRYRHPLNGNLEHYARAHSRGGVILSSPAGSSPRMGALSVERRRPGAGAGLEVGSSNIQAFICSNCGRATTVLPSLDSFATMLLCSCGNPVIPATPAQIISAVSRRAATSQQQRGTSPQLINLLPTMKFKEDSLKNEAAAKLTPGEDDKISCRVCLCDYESGSTLRILPCLHKFHHTCIDQWLVRSPLCPLCNTSVEVVYNDPRYSDVPIPALSW